MAMDGYRQCRGDAGEDPAMPCRDALDSRRASGQDPLE
jgi:hypothetical protein